MLNFWQKLKKKGTILALAPMAGITDAAFCALCREFGADVVYSEMISADALYYGSKKTMEMLKIHKRAHPVVVQLFGKRPELFKKAVKIVQDAGADGIDINFGCPAKKVVNHGGGVSLMRDLPLCREIVENVLEASDVPVSVKMRTGIKTPLNPPLVRGEIEDTPLNLPLVRGEITGIDFVKNIIDLPISAIMVHGRTYEQGFRGEPDYEMIKKIAQLVAPPTLSGIVVLGNGGINTPEKAKEMLDKTGADGLGIAQGVFGRPWIFNDIKKYLAKGDFEEINFKKIKKIAIKHAKLAYKLKGDHGIIEMRKHLLWYVKGWPNAKQLREKLVRVESVKEIERNL